MVYSVVNHYYKSSRFLRINFFCNDLKSRMDKIMALRKEINATYEKEGVKLSVNDFVIKAVALACKRVPECNSAWMETFIR